jgi:hypothetical protein
MDKLYRCQKCEFTGGEGDFVPAVNPEHRHTIGDIYSDLECTDCGCLVFPVDNEKKPERFIVVHEHDAGIDLYEFKSNDHPDVLMAKKNRRRIAKLLEIDFEPQKHERLEVRWVRQERRPLIAL